MKRIIATILTLTLIALCLASCGSINKDGEVSVLWSDMSDDYLATIADALDRAMYIENIKYTHYDAEGDNAKQLTQAKDAIKAGATALVVSSDDLSTATAILNAAKEADIPVVFLCASAALPNTFTKLYDKCAVVNVDATSLYEVLGEKIAADLLANYDGFDRNADGKITYAAFGISGAAVATVNSKLTEAGKSELVPYSGLLALPTTGISATVNAMFKDYDGTGNTVNETPVELIITDDDAYVEELLMALRGYKLNYEKLVTHYIPLYTVGLAANAADVGYGAPEGELSESDKEMRAAYSVMNAIDNGYLSAAALENDDEIALSCAKILRNFIKDNAILDGVSDTYKNGDAEAYVPYTIY